MLLRIKFRQGGWLRHKISPGDSLTARQSTRNTRYFTDMHESVRLAARLHFIPAACLPRSIVLADMLRARGHAAQVLLGVRPGGNAIASHAWVEVDGQMIAEPESVETDFTRLQ